MRPSLMDWLARHGLPTWLAPDYATMVGLAGLLGAMSFFWLARRDGANRRAEGRALLAVYAAALAGGYVAEWIRVAPLALLQRSTDPFFHVGRSAYGGFLFGSLAATLVLRRHRLPVLPFLDRTVPLLGITYAFVRTGCFLAGCDYGVPTSSALGVRFPVGSSAAVSHAAHGWVPVGVESLPVHATQLYEAGLALAAAAIASLWLARGHRDGRAFATWAALYAISRFAVETLRGDVDRGVALGLSTAQFVSIGVLMTLAVVSLRRARARTTARALAAAGAASLVALLAFASPAPAAAQTTPQSEFGNRRVELTADVGAFLVPGRFAVENGLTFGLDAAFRVPSSGRVRFQVGAGFRGASTYDATHLGLRAPLGIGIGVGRFAEIYVGATLGYTRILFDSPYFAGVNAFAGSLEAGLRFMVSSRVAIGIHPLVFGLYASPDIDTLPTYEPKLLTLSVAVP